MARRDDSDRPKKSWREIDKGRDKGFSGQRGKDARAQERVERSPLYEQYKAKVSRMFEGGELPDMLREKLDPTGAMKARDDLLRKIKVVVTENRGQAEELVAEFVAKHELPEDPYWLVDWLDHKNDGVVEKCLDKLEQMADAGVLVGAKLPKSLDQRLVSLDLMGSDPDVQAKARSLRARLRG